LTLIGRGFVWTNFFSMLAVLGWLYIVAPVRVCNSYLVNDQEHAGWYMVILAILLFVWWLGALLVGSGIDPHKPGGGGSGPAHAYHYYFLPRRIEKVWTITRH